MAYITVRKLKNGDSRYDVCYRDPGGKQRSHTFASRQRATDHLHRNAVAMNDGVWVDAAGGKVRLSEFARGDLKNRQLRPRTRETYDDQLRLHILPFLGDIPIAKITAERIRSWYAGLIDGGLSRNTAAKCYRLVRSVMNTAVDDGLIARNPCRIKGAGVERAAEREIASVEQIWAAADAMPDRLRLAVLIGGFVGLRKGEILGLERRHVDIMHRTLAVEQQQQQLKNGTLIVGPPKTEAGRRLVSLPDQVVGELEVHLALHVASGKRARLFVGEKGGPLRPHVLQKYWVLARGAAGLSHDFTFHDLRHTAHTLAAQSGATTKELMYRMGQSSSSAAMRYQHATRERDAALATELGNAIARPERRTAKRIG